MAQKSIKINRVLAELDIAMDVEGKQKTFSIRFIKKDGKSVFIFRAFKTGLNILMGE